MAPQKLWERHEGDIAELFGGQLTLGSGNKFEKLDIQVDRNGTTWRPLIECKCTSKGSYGVKVGLWDEIVQHVYERSDEMRPMLALRFYGPDVGRNTPILADLAIQDINHVAEMYDTIKRLTKRVEELGIMLSGP